MLPNPSITPEVATIIIVNDLPEIQCPSDTTTTLSAEVILSGATPAGGEYSGINVNNGIFDPSGLAFEDYTITYTYTDQTTNCTNTCTFEISITFSTIDAIDIDGDVVPVSVCLGTYESEAISSLPQQIRIGDSDNLSYIVDLSWVISGYNAQSIGSYNAVGTFSLPEGILQTDPETPLRVSTTISVVELPEVNCPEDMNILSNSIITLEGATPEGGIYSGLGVVNGEFNSTGFEPGNYAVIYTYSYPSGCSNFCTFSIGVDMPVGVQLSSLSGINIYPNPNSGKFNIEFGDYEGNLTYQICNTSGEIILEEKILSNRNIIKEFSLNFAPGLYYIKITTDNESVVL